MYSMIYQGESVLTISSAKENIRNDLTNPDTFHSVTPEHVRDLAEAYFAHPDLEDAVEQQKTQLVLPTVPTVITKSEHILYRSTRREVIMDSMQGMIGMSIIDAAIYRRHRLTPPIIARLGTVAFNPVPVAEGSVITVTTPCDAVRASFWNENENSPTTRLARLMLQLPTAPTVFDRTARESQAR